MRLFSVWKGNFEKLFIVNIQSNNNMPNSPITRRSFLELAGAGGLAFAIQKSMPM